MHGGGLGYGRMDAAGGRLSLSSEGKITASFGFEECGQGILAAIEHIVMEELGCAAEDISIVIGDTAKVPKSGSSTASRGTSMVWHAIQRLKKPFLAQLKNGRQNGAAVQRKTLFPALQDCVTKHKGARDDV